jgi:hypothetical protein
MIGLSENVFVKCRIDFYIFLGFVIYKITTLCTTDREHLMKRILEHLEREGLDPKYLREDRIHDEP